MTAYRHSCAGLGVALLLGGCRVGPDFHTPAPPIAAAYDREGTQAMVAPAGVAGGTQQWVDERPRDGWWHAFGSAALDRLIDAGLHANTDLAATRAALAVARESWLATRGGMVPTIDVAAGSSRNKSSEYLSPPLNASPFTYGLQTAQVTVGYNFDLFGLNRRTVEAARAQYDSTVWQAQGARTSLINTLIAAAFADAAARAQVTAQERMIAIARETRDIVERQRAQGQVSGADVLAQDTALAQAEAALPPLQRSAALAHNLVAYLTGRSAADAPPDAVDWATIALPQNLPLTLPSVLVRQRPDIRSAEANLHAASAGIGIAIANRLPQLTLSASAGGNSAGWSDLLSATRSFWSIGAGVTQSVFAGGALLHRQRAARAAYDEADAQYRSTVLGAFRNVADTLAALRTDADGLRSAQAARDTALASLAISRRQYEHGATGFVAVLSAESAVQQAEQALVQAQLARLIDTAALFEALGGDWQGAAVGE